MYGSGKNTQSTLGKVYPLPSILKYTDFAFFKSKFNLRKTLSYGVDGIVGYSIKPLKIATVMGFITSILGFIYLIYLIIKTIVVGIETPGFATIVCLILFIGGIELLCIGILGEYISKVFVETKNRPIYLEKNSLGFEDDIL